ncbi:CRP-like cAMP-binding protein [Nonlabens dokdonensis]|jgi:CRP-like cAMP-binding protein|uniref:Cyclic nucleotide-binding protein n=2 Tax=Nonlabens dokdonensis TaxID=328515 RepID=L7W9H5_NONDD|nr:Crp/Fnr family transcriptional regulator [Nonlabens dokdonensis]AGC76784.1 cyclic nucleotide-binding protein [Nonlabens dokdonensis DSW-6]PZX44429.1 CRP-like cAMP-binding protein [Nonlabens dokdonensis]
MELPSFLHDLTGEGDKPSLEYANEIFSMLEVVKMRKKQVLLHLGEVAHSIYIVKTGILKGSLKDEDGNMHTIRFVAEGNVMTAMYSFVDQKPSNLQIECIESGEVLCFKHQDFEYMSKLYSGLTPAFHKIMLKRYHDMVEEKSRMIGDDATTRYKKFIVRYAPIVDRLPLKEIASFLGIRQQSLSRLRSKMDAK